MEKLSNTEAELKKKQKTKNLAYKKKVWTAHICSLLSISDSNHNATAEAISQRCSVKKVFLEISQNSQENTSARVSFLSKLQASGLQLYKKRDSGTVISLWILQNF